MTLAAGRPPPRPPTSAAMAGVHRAVAAHPDVLALAAILLIGAALRLAFSPRAPVFVHGDAHAYYPPADALMHGHGFPLPLKRPPGYPVFVALIGMLFGADLRALVAVQHGLGLGTAALTYGVGRIAFGRAAGLAAGLAAALSGGLLILEHYVLSEALFTFLLTLAVFLLMLGLRGGSRWSFAAGGLAIGLATLTRSPAQLMLAIVPVVALVHYRRWRPALLTTGLVIGAAALVLVPWMSRNRLVHGSFSVAGGIGQHLVSRVAIGHSEFVFYDEDSPPDEADRRRLRTRRLIQDVAGYNAEKDDGPNLHGIDVHRRLMQEFRLSESEADALIREVVVQAIRDNPSAYIRLAAADSWRIFVGVPMRLRGAWQSAEPFVTGYKPLAALTRPASPEQARDIETTEQLTLLYTPNRAGLLVSLLFLVGLLASLAVPAWRLGLLPALTVITLAMAAGATVRFLARYHYPGDPLAHVVACGGAVAAWRLGALLIARARAAGGWTVES